MSVVHACPPEGSDAMPCCGRDPFTTPRDERLTRDAAKVTCTAPSPGVVPPPQPAEEPGNFLHLLEQPQYDLVERPEKGLTHRHQEPETLPNMLGGDRGSRTYESADVELPCPTCQGRNRETTDMVCMTCGRDYMPDDGTDETGPGLGWKRLMGLWREQCKQAEAQRDRALAEVVRFEEQFPCDGMCSDYPEEDCSRHGRSPADLWQLLIQTAADRNKAGEERERLRDRIDNALTYAHERELYYLAEILRGES